MKVTYNSQQDALRVLFNDAPICTTSKPSSNVVLDFDQNGDLVGLELANASFHVQNPYAIDAMVTEKHPDVGKQMEKMHNEDPKKWGRETKPKWDATPEDWYVRIVE